MSRYSLWEVTSLLCISLVMLLSLFTVASGLPYHIEGIKQYDNVEGADQPDLILEMLARLSQSILRENDLENSKRGLDLGLSRGFSGSQAAKHLMGLAAANYAGGPGRRRRSDSDQYLSS
ncbi:hypothetical protein M8J77_016344 [Diaphorina citri]|uniref:Neuropeptide DH31 n=1 Tax=Diaphorina citri TaxID=121845 RepID=A0A2U9PG10_DIACI|nr:neuropeptide DH31 [Diaphorina citri]KAI5731805.1 hypothetical protein M8J77_016344 [Diaphorina citri]